MTEETEVQELVLEGLFMTVSADLYYNLIPNTPVLRYLVEARDAESLVFSLVKMNTADPKIEFNEEKMEHYNELLKRHMVLEDLARIPE